MNDISQKIVDDELFEKSLKYIESNFSGETGKKFAGQTIFINLPGFNSQKAHINTTVKDLKEVCGDVKITWLENLSQCIGQSYENPVIYSLRFANKKDFRGKLKYTPADAMTLVMATIAVGGELYAEKAPIKQNERVVNNTELPDIERERKAFTFLEYNSPCSLDNKPPKKPQLLLDVSQRVQRMMELYYDIDNSWAIVYFWENITFAFPMEQQFIKEVLKNREKENGRRAIIPTIVHSHKRNGKSVGSFIREPKEKIPYVMNGRKFHVLIGSEAYEQAFSTESARRRIKKEIETHKQEIEFRKTVLGV